MVGKYNIRITTKKVVYEFDIKRKYTIIKGDSSTGKSYLYTLIGTPNIDLVCKSEKNEAAVIPLPKVKSAYSVVLTNTEKSIIFIDEDTEDFGSDDFIRLLQNSDNYFVIITRKKLSNIPISVQEIYEISSDTKYNNLNRLYVYNTLKNVYAEDSLNVVEPDLFLVEDYGSGYDFFSKVLDCECKTACGNANVASELIAVENKYDTIVVFVDGAAFGAFMDDVSAVIKRASSAVVLLFPESFEYVLLKNGVAETDNRVLDETYDYCDEKAFRELSNDYPTGACKFESWEQFYTIYLQYLTSNTAYQYTKKSKRLNDYYMRFWGKIKRFLRNLK